MKVINEKGKLFGIINPVDLVILLVLLLAVGGIGWKMMNTVSDNQPSETVTALVTVRARPVVPEVAESIKAMDPVGQHLMSGSSVTSATIESASFKSYSTQLATADGEYVMATAPISQDVTFTIRTQVDADSANPAIGIQEIRVGRNFNVKTQYFEIAGTIEAITYGD